MTVAERIRKRIKSIPERTPFGYTQLDIEPDNFYTVAKVLERLQKQGVIKRAAKGIFYKPKLSIFGELGLDYDALLNSYLFKNEKRIGYVTGTTIYNELNLTTQIPNVTKIATRTENVRRIKTNSFRVKIVKPNTEITEENYQLLSLLDALKDFKKIPDLDKKSGITILSNKLKELNAVQTNLFIKCALKYPPRVRAFTGALLENINVSDNLYLLKKSLNPLSEYEYGVENILSTAKNWNIK